MKLAPLKRAVLSHKLRTTVRTSTSVMVTTMVVEGLRSERLPTRAVQASNLIRAIGDTIVAGDVFVPEDSLPALIGALDEGGSHRLLEELCQVGLVEDIGPATTTDFYGIKQPTTAYDLTLRGWDIYEKERRGQTAGRYGFLAMKFNDAILEGFAEGVIKPAVAKRIGYELIDLRDVSRAGIIDNLLREQIRDAAFVLVDLTHDNSGAYWEAGYAEGLGKPVIYICDQIKFEEKQTHFDTNHCTTVLWNVDEPETFSRALIATLRRSLNLFPDREE